MLALTHHILVRLSAFRAGLDPRRFHDYAILGDDIVIANKAVHDHYREIIFRLGVQVRESKCVNPSPLIGAEFASKIFASGEEYSPLPFGLILEGSSFRLFSLWTELGNRVLSMPEDVRESHDLWSLTHAPDLGTLFPLSGREVAGTEWAFSILYNSLYKKGKTSSRSGQVASRYQDLELLPLHFAELF